MSRSAVAVPLAVLAAWTLLGVTSCATVDAPRSAWRWFGPPGYGDAWSGAVEQWQEREGTRNVGAAAAVARAASRRADAPPSLALAYLDFHAERRRGFARDVASWIQDQAQGHFIADGAVDRWGTLEEVLAANGDDCDGLALLAYHLLREFGFREGELYQAIVYRAEDDQYHMVTLWFEDPHDPWVIDPTAAMVDEMVRISSVPDWRPLKLFTEREEYTVRPTRLHPVAAPPPGH